MRSRSASLSTACISDPEGDPQEDFPRRLSFFFASNQGLYYLFTRALADVDVLGSMSDLPQAPGQVGCYVAGKGMTGEPRTVCARPGPYYFERAIGFN